MTIFRTIVAAASILLVLLSTPTVVEGTCKCKEVCPNWVYILEYEEDPGFYIGINPATCQDRCWDVGKQCKAEKHELCNAYCTCNFFGCNCKGCELVLGACGWTRRMMENEDTCADFDFVTSLSAEEKRDYLADKYCDDDQVACKDIYKVLVSFALLEFEGVDHSKVESYIQNAGGIDKVLTCDLFNKSYGDVSHLRLCDDKPLGLPASTKKGKKQKKTS